MLRVHIVLYGCEGNSKRCKKTAHFDIFFVSLKKFSRLSFCFFFLGEKIITFCALCSVTTFEREREKERERRDTLSPPVVSRKYSSSHRCNTTTLCCRSPLELSSSSKSILDLETNVSSKVSVPFSPCGEP